MTIQEIKLHDAAMKLKYTGVTKAALKKRQRQLNQLLVKITKTNEFGKEYIPAGQAYAGKKLKDEIAVIKKAITL